MLSVPSCLFHVSAGEVFSQLHLSVLNLIYKVVMGTVVTIGKVDHLFPAGWNCLGLTVLGNKPDFEDVAFPFQLWLH